MNRILPRSGTVVIALVLTSLGSAAPAQERYAPRYYDDASRYERIYRERRVYEPDDRYFEERLRYYSRENVSRREAERARRIPRSAERRREGVRVPFLQRLFGETDPEEVDEGWTVRRDPGAVEIRRPPANRARRRAPVEEGDRAPVPTPPPAVADKPAVAATTFVAVFGDSIGDGLATGLREAFADAPELAVRTYAKANAGLVREDYFDIVEEARRAVASGPITYAVVDVGVNDRQPFLSLRDAPPLSAKWRQLYVARLDGLLAAFKEKNVPVYWVGLAPSESTLASADHIALNALAKERVETAGGTYVDVWEGFVDENGDYVAVGPRLDGQAAKLRLDDGVHFSKAGARKLAHYVEREIRKLFQPKAATPETLLSALTPPVADPAAAIAAETPFEADRPKPIAGPLVVLTTPRRAEGGALLAAATPPPPARTSAVEAERLLVKGEALDADPGRLDDHRWPDAAASGR